MFFFIFIVSVKQRCNFKDKCQCQFHGCATSETDKYEDKPMRSQLVTWSGEYWSEIFIA